jgi:hypothetical protein
VQQARTVTTTQIRGKPLSSKNNGEALGATVLGLGDFQLGSPESRMAARIRLQRIGVAGELPSDCICFPTNEPPFCGTPMELEIAAKVQCPLHGDRFPPQFFVYVSGWLRAKIWKHLWSHHTEQYRKAWFASFPPSLWPAEKEVTEDGRVFLRLKDGTELPV